MAGGQVRLEQATFHEPTQFVGDDACRGVAKRSLVRRRGRAARALLTSYPTVVRDSLRFEALKGFKRICFCAPPTGDMLAAVVDLQSEEIRAAVEAALLEDVGEGDVTTSATVPDTSRTRALMRARQPLTLAGIDFAIDAFRSLCSDVRSNPLARDGDPIDAGGALLEIAGPTRAILSAERVALNFVQRLSGVATMTSRFVKAVAGTKARILDTRKTIPGWRRFEKYAVACGGGTNHRFGLYDMVLIKDNHLAALAGAEPNPIARAVELARGAHPQLTVEVEADTLAQVRQAMEAGADFILLDNMGTQDLLGAVQVAGGRCRLEASGGVTLDTVRSIAETGVDFISVGALTHSAPAADIGLDLVS